MAAPTIFDLGCHKGEDADFYLRKGFRVVALEANPTLCTQLRERFKEAIADGRMVLVEKAIAETAGEVQFFINTKLSVWGTIRSDWAERNAALGAGSTVITVPATTFDSLLETFGAPHYLKIDIEGADLLCLEALQRYKDRPQFVSIESEKKSWAALRHEFHILKRLGYTKFKIVDQGLVPQQTPPHPATEGRYVDYRFAEGASGLFGSELPGDWLSEREALRRYRWIFLSYKLTGDEGLLKRVRALRRIVKRYKASWYDTHATM
jgi:FkbM family methyltransferase